MTERKIQILGETTINQIAAGEVIENPASVVKELVENAIDAGSTDISIETGSAGRAFIRVADNGCGMEEDNLWLAIERHATSKLREVGDLESLLTLGFRGEALPSIAAVSHLSLHSATKKSMGSLLTLSGGQLGQLKPQPRQPGTTVDVRSLFFNVPVRKKFQQSLTSDFTELGKVIQQFALCYPQIAFSWKNEGQPQLECGQNESIEQRILALLGEEWHVQSLSVEQSSGEMQLHGRSSRPSFHRPNRAGQTLFINQRAIHSPWVAQQILTAYGTRLTLHRFPLFVLHLTLPPSWIDVNVHPQKREVRLRQEERVASFLREVIEKSLETRTTTIPLSLPPLEQSLSFHEPIATYAPAQETPDWFEETPYKVIGSLKNYLFVEEKEGIRIVDSSRASERIIYDQLTQEKESPEAQTLLLPLQLTLKGAEKSHLIDKLSELEEIGFSIRPFGGDTFLIDAIPALLEPSEIIDWIHLYLTEGAIPKKINLKRSSISQGAAPTLLRQLFRCPNPDSSPSGKPIHTLLDAQKLEKLLT